MHNKSIAAWILFLLCVTTSSVVLGQEAPPIEPSATIVVEKGSPLSISGNTEICAGTETILKAEGEFESFTWDKGGVKGRYLKVTEPGKYEVTAKTKGGCTFTTTVTVRLRPCPV